MMKIQAVTKKIGFSLVMLCIGTMYASKVGSDQASSRQLKTFFPATHSDNSMFGFAVFNKGLTLENESTQCTFDAFFPIAGNIMLNGGELLLNRDLELKNPMQLGAGTINGQGNSLVFPSNVSDLSIPTQYYTRLLGLLDRKDIGDNVNAVDWSYDDKYVAMASETASGLHELQVYYFDGKKITLSASFDFGSKDAYTVRWHPSNYSLAVGQDGDAELKMFIFDPLTQTLSLNDSADIGRVQALKWHPSGNYLAVGRYNNANLLVYEVQNAVFTNFYTSFYGTVRTVQRNSLCWCGTGAYLAVGLDSKDDDTEVKVYTFNGSSLTFNADIELGSHAYALAWHPTKPILAVGTSGGDQRLRLFQHNALAGTFTELMTSRADENRPVFGLDWSSDGVYLAEVKNKDSGGHEIRVFHYDSQKKTLNLVSGYEANNHVRAVKWAHNDTYLATGDVGNELCVFDFQPADLIFNNIKLFFNSDVILRSPIRFEGSCSINVSDEGLEVDESAEIIVASGASLTIEHAKIKGIKDTNIRCEDDTALLILRDVTWMQDGNFTFTVGAMQFKNDVEMIGDYIFAYQTVQTSTVLSRSRLTLDAGFTFSYDPNTNNQSLLQFTDNTSQLIFEGATLHTTMTGIRLTKGKIVIKRDSFLSSEKNTVDGVTIDNGIIFGDGISENDLACEILSGEGLHVTQGSLRYNNVNASSWNMIGGRSFLRIEAGASLRLFEDLNLGDGSLQLSQQAEMIPAGGKTLIGNVFIVQ